MAGLALTTSLPRYGRQLGAMIARNQRSSGVFVPLTRRFQASCRKEASSGGFEMARKDTKEGINEAKAAGETVVDEVTQKTKRGGRKGIGGLERSGRESKTNCSRCMGGC
ncbi:hypothetical protein OIU77_024229 [Salix suchowensis]|uniref:Uncharacterized protein n=1 Tax=Salix suchowensis TaxID=1278906 RepID=A0ABQ9BU55_9ROSI|nr:hypothetical protein OIU77_024229 [Salix suchowensis]